MKNIYNLLNKQKLISIFKIILVVLAPVALFFLSIQFEIIQYLKEDNFKAFLIVMLVYSVIVLGLALLHFKKRHRDFRANLSPHGEYNEVLGSINFEMMNQRLDLNKKISITRNWLIYMYLSELKVLNFKDILWTYPVDLKENYAISYQQNFYLTNNKEVSIKLNDINERHRLQEILKTKSPNADFGYSDTIMLKWQNNRRNQHA